MCFVLNREQCALCARNYIMLSLLHPLALSTEQHLGRAVRASHVHMPRSQQIGNYNAVTSTRMSLVVSLHGWSGKRFTWGRTALSAQEKWKRRRWKAHVMILLIFSTSTLPAYNYSDGWCGDKSSANSKRKMYAIWMAVASLHLKMLKLTSRKFEVLVLHISHSNGTWSAGVPYASAKLYTLFKYYLYALASAVARTGYVCVCADAPYEIRVAHLFAEFKWWICTCRWGMVGEKQKEKLDRMHCTAEFWLTPWRCRII